MSGDEEITDEQFWEQTVRYGLDAYIETQNPIWAWHAVEHWLLAQRHPKPVSLPLPPELIGFLLQTTAGIINLAAGRKPVEYRDGEPVKPSGGFEIKASDACDFLPEALQLRGRKWNAFVDYARSTGATHFSLIYRIARECLGETELEAMETLRKHSSVSDPRTLRRKMKGGRGPRQKSPYPAPKWLHQTSDEIGEAPAMTEPKKAEKVSKPKATGAKKA